MGAEEVIVLVGVELPEDTRGQERRASPKLKELEQTTKRFHTCFYF